MSSINKSQLIAAGKSIKAVAISLLILFLCIIASFLFLKGSSSPESIKKIYLFLIVSSVLLNLIVLVSLYNAGSQLEASAIE
jgi:fumarate reductase subunit D